MAEVAASWAALRMFMKEHCGVHLAEDQHYLMEARLAPVARTLQFATVEDYVLEACRPGAGPSVTSPLIDAMTTHETYFFRDAPFWKVLSERILPSAAAGTAPFRVWCAACSTGQEAHTLSMLVEERFPQLFERLSIIGTDVSGAVLETARRASYTVFEVNRGITAHRLLRHFERDGGQFRLKERIRSRTTWATQNLVTHSPPGGEFDLVLARNVLIYFQSAVRERVLQRLGAALRPQGVLGVGGTETLATWPGAPLGTGWYSNRPL